MKPGPPKAGVMYIHKVAGAGFSRTDPVKYNLTPIYRILYTTWDLFKPEYRWASKPRHLQCIYAKVHEINIKSSERHGECIIHKRPQSLV